MPSSVLENSRWAPRDYDTAMCIPEVDPDKQGTKHQRALASAYVGLMRPLMLLLGTAWADGTDDRSGKPFFTNGGLESIIAGRAVAVPGWMPSIAHEVAAVIRTARAEGHAAGIEVGTRMLRRLAAGTLTVDDMNAAVKAAKGERA